MKKVILVYFIIKNLLILLIAFGYFYFYFSLNKAKKSIKETKEPLTENKQEMVKSLDEFQMMMK